MLEKKKTKTKKRSIIFMLILATTIIVGASTAYAMTKTDKGTTLRGWSYTFVGSYESSTGEVSGSTKASFRKHNGCYTEVKAYKLNASTYYAYGKDEDYKVSCRGYAGKKNNEVRVYHFAYSREGTNSAGGHTIY